MNAPSLSNSVAANAVGGAIVTILSWVLSTRGITVPDAAISAGTVIVGFIGHYLSLLLMGPKKS